MADHDWNANYASGELPWDSGEPEHLLVEFVQAGRVASGKALEIGAGTGTNAIWLAQQGFDVLGVDVAPLAVERARAKADGQARFEVCDFLAAPPAGRFGFAFDRGCFHVFDEPSQRTTYARHVAERLAPGGVWLSLIGSTEGPPRDFGPPRRSARDIADAIEPVLAIEELTLLRFDGLPVPATAWRLVARARAVPAQPSTT